MGNVGEVPTSIKWEGKLFFNTTHMHLILICHQVYAPVRGGSSVLSNSQCVSNLVVVCEDSPAFI